MLMYANRSLRSIGYLCKSTEDKELARIRLRRGGGRRPCGGGTKPTNEESA